MLVRGVLLYVAFTSPTPELVWWVNELDARGPFSDVTLPLALVLLLWDNKSPTLIPVTLPPHFIVTSLDFNNNGFLLRIGLSISPIPNSGL